jgi:hypothetical protein
MKAQINLGLKDSSNAQLLVDADSYVTHMTDNPRFAAAEFVAQITKTKIATTAFRAAVNAPTSDTKTDDIKKAREALERELTKLKNEVEGLANDPATPDADREAIVHSAGMKLKGRNHAPSRVFMVENDEISGTVYLSAPGGANAHEWQYTSDVANGTGRIAIDTTTVASTEIAGLQKGTEYAFFHKAIVVGTKTDWEGPILLIVT